ncbi:MAG: VCBS repeat-containing protein, partial [Dokdonella sp.]
MALLVAACGVARVSQAQNRLGPLDNALIKNPYPSPADSQFGRGVVSGDFDGDGIDDLAISEFNSDRLRILRGVAFTVGTNPVIKFIGTTVTMPIHDFEMVSGDFDGDGRDEIAVGSAGMSYAGMNAAGGVYVMNLAGGTWAVQSEIHPGGAYPGAPQASANVGFSLSTGDFDDDGYADLAIGIPGQTVAGVSRAGAVMITYGGLFGIIANHARIIDRDSDGLTFTPRQDDYFG